MFESRCGILCGSCEGKDESGCTGCLNMAKPFWGGECSVKSCCENRSLNHCGECGDFPCKTAADMGKEQGFDPGPRLENCRRWAAERKRNNNMLDYIPTEKDMTELLGPEKYAVWRNVCSAIESRYDMEQLWNSGGKKWDYEYKYRRGGKTLCALYAKKNCFGFMVIFGKAEREQFESQRSDYSPQIRGEYDAATTYHDGKWLMIEPENTSLTDDLIKLLLIKRKPNRK